MVAKEFAVLGDVLCIVGATIYACSNVGVEMAVKRYGKVPYYLFFSFFAVLISSIQSTVLESAHWGDITLDTVPFFALFVGVIFLFYIGVPWMLAFGGSALFNLSLLTSDLYAIFISIFLLNQEVCLWCFINVSFPCFILCL